MILKILIFIAYAIPTAYLFYKLVRGGCAVKGNEPILLLLPPLFLLLSPGDGANCFAKLSFASTPLLFWFNLSIINYHLELKRFFYLYLVLLIVILFEYTTLYLDLGGNVIFLTYTSLCLVVIVSFNVWLIFAKRRCRHLNDILSVGRLYDLFIWVSLAMSLFGGAMVFILLLKCRWVPQVAIVLLLGLEQIVVFCSSPHCLKGRVVKGKYDRKNAYMIEKSVKGGCVLQDDSFGIVSEDVIDDARLLSSLIELFEREKLYRNADIKIGNVAIMLGTNKTYLSRALNTRVGKNFCQFVNFYRVREVCQLYLEDTSKDIRKISESAGFSSPSNFSIVFKYSTGFSPCDWCRVVKSKIESDEQVSVDDFVV